MTTEDIIIHLFCYVDDQLGVEPRDARATLYPSEIVAIGILFALKGGRFRAFYRWLSRDYSALFAGLPDRTTLIDQLAQFQHLCDRLLGQASVLTVADSYPIELIFPIREGRSKGQLGQKSKDKGRWSIGLKLC